MPVSRLAAPALIAALIAGSASWAAPRPVLPPTSAGAIDVPAMSACDQPASAKAIANSGADRMEALQTRMMGHAQYATSLTLWKTERLKELKVWTQEDATAFSRGLMADEAFQKANADSLAMANKLQARTEELRAVIDSGSDRDSCRGLVELLAGGRDLESLVARQWAIIDARLAAAAKAGGVSLD